MRTSVLLVAVALGLHCVSARLLLDAPLDSLSEACQIVDGQHPSRRNCSKALMASTTCVERWAVEREHLTQTLVPRPGGRSGACTDFTVRWCENSIYPQKGGCYRSKYAHTGLMGYDEVRTRACTPGTPYPTPPRTTSRAVRIVTCDNP